MSLEGRSAKGPKKYSEAFLTLTEERKSFCQHRIVPVAGDRNICPIKLNLCRVEMDT